MKDKLIDYCQHLAVLCLGKGAVVGVWHYPYGYVARVDDAKGHAQYKSLASKTETESWRRLRDELEAAEVVT